MSGSAFEQPAGRSLSAGLRDQGRLQAALLPVATVATLGLPLALFYSRTIADALLSAVAALFLLRCCLAADFSPFRAAWFRWAAALWVWLLAASLLAGTQQSVEQALVLIRLWLFALALEQWVLTPASARRLLFWVFAALAAWMMLECWQQYLLGSNLVGYSRWPDGALTGPFEKPRAGSAYIVLFFPALLPLVMAGLGRREAWARAGGVLLLIAGVATMLLIGQRMPALLMLLGLVASALLLPRFRVPMLLAILVGLLVLVATPVISPPTFQKLVLRFLEQMRDFPTSNYGVLYVRSLVMLQAHPWLGLGVDGFRHACADPQYFHGVAALGVSEAEQGGLRGCSLHPHNYYLELATDGGLPGLALFTALVAAWFRRLAPPRGAGAPLPVALFVAVLIQLWPAASTTALFVLPTAGWLLLTVGWGLAEASHAPAPIALRANS